jgi:hypothetical protein
MPDRIITKEIKFYNPRVIEYMLNAGTGELTVRFCIMWGAHICVWNYMWMKICGWNDWKKWLQSMDHPVPLKQASGLWYIYLPIRSITPCIKVLNDKLIDWRLVCESYKRCHVSSAVITFLWYLLCVSHIDEVTGNAHSWFFFVRASAFEVPNIDKRDPCSTRHEEYCGNFLQKLQPLLQFSAIM